MNSRCPLRLPALLMVFAAVLPEIGASAEVARHPRTLQLVTRDTLQVAELQHGDTLQFRLKNGQERKFRLKNTSARIIERPRGGVIYSFDCELVADGQPLLLRRYVCSQETFYEPWVINGVRMWLSSSKSVFDLVPIRYPEAHDKLDADLILAVQDASLPICPEPMQPWFPIKEHFIDVGTCYNGDDPWLGPYLGEACHVGLDINMPKGTSLYAPIDFDDQWIFSADHRWRGVRRWPNGDTWALQSHHVDKLLLEENTKVKAGTHYAEGAGKGVGTHQHSHFEFRLGREVLNRGQLGGIEVDPWILFWQIFETDKARRGALQVAMQSPAPAKTGEKVAFAAAASGKDSRAEPLQFFWTFGDGGWSNEQNPTHTFIHAGVHPVTVVVESADARVTHTQHITVNGPDIAKPSLILKSPDNFTFRPRPVQAADVYGWRVKFIPHTLSFTTGPKGERPPPQHVLLNSAAPGVLPATKPPRIAYAGGHQDWLRVERERDGEQERLATSIQAEALPLGRHVAIVTVNCADAINGRQGFRVELNVRLAPSTSEVVIDDRDAEFYATPYFWVGHQFSRCQARGHANRYLTNGGRSTAGEFVRFTPDLEAGRYEVLLRDSTPLARVNHFPVRIRHAGGVAKFNFKASDANSRSLGAYDFHGDASGFVEFHASGSEGAVVADAVRFVRVHP